MKIKLFEEFINEAGVNSMQQNRYEDELKSAVWDYVAGYTTAINNILRKKRVIKKGSEEVIDKLDRAFDVLGTKTKIDVYRTIDWDYLFNIYGMTKDNIDDFIGKEFKNRGYMSTAEEFISPWSSGWLDEELVMHITSEYPYPNLNINTLFNADEIDCEDQKEILLPRDTTLILQSYQILNSKKHKSFSKKGNYVLEMVIK